MIENYKKNKLKIDNFEGVNSYTVKDEQLFNFNYLFKLDIFKLLFEKENLNSLSIEYDLIFIFNDITWRNIVTLFKLKGINLYGGSSNRRHLLSTVQAQLTTFLLFLNDLNLDKNLIYNSFNELSVTNNKIDRFIVENVNSKISFKNLSELKVSSPDSDLYFLYKHNLLMNISLRLLNLITDIETSKNENISLQHIKSEKEKNLVSFINGQYSGKLQEKKIRNTRKTIEELDLKLKEILDKITNSEKEIKDITSYLFFLDKNLFYDNGEFKLNRSIKLCQ